MFNLNLNTLVITLMRQVKKLAHLLCQNMFNSVMKNQHRKKLHHQRKLLHKLKNNQLLRLLSMNKLDQLFSQELRFMMMLQKLDNSWLSNKLKWKCKLRKTKRNLLLELKLISFPNKKVIQKNIKFKD